MDLLSTRSKPTENALLRSIAERKKHGFFILNIYLKNAKRFIFTSFINYIFTYNLYVQSIYVFIIIILLFYWKIYNIDMSKFNIKFNIKFDNSIFTTIFTTMQY
ncbi:hypothetical protein V1477_021318 [Vespula maculifrons]|uniref:Uncharacterized protein n=1 Tax=Vespula maculifrons TaxID=7453 RepID=A0ABD2AGS5_VESMC